MDLITCSIFYPMKQRNQHFSHYSHALGCMDYHIPGDTTHCKQFSCHDGGRLQTNCPLRSVKLINILSWKWDIFCVLSSLLETKHFNPSSFCQFLKDVLRSLKMAPVSSEKGLFIINPFPDNPWFLRPLGIGLMKILWEKEKMLVISIFSFSHNVFFLIWDWNCYLRFVVGKCFQFGQGPNFAV